MCSVGFFHDRYQNRCRQFCSSCFPIYPPALLVWSKIFRFKIRVYRKYPPFSCFFFLYVEQSNPQVCGALCAESLCCVSALRPLKIHSRLRSKISSLVMLVGVACVFCRCLCGNGLLDSTLLNRDVGGRHLGVWGYVSPLHRSVCRHICATASHGKVAELLG